MSDGMIDRAMQFNYQMLRPKDVEDKKDKQPQKAETGAEGTESAQDAETQKPTKQLLTKDTSTKPLMDGAKQETAKQAEQPETRKLGQEKEDFVPTTQEEVQTPEAATDLQGPLAQLVQKQAFAPKEAKIFSTPTASEAAETQKQQDAEGATQTSGTAAGTGGKAARSRSQVSDFFMESWLDFAGSAKDEKPRHMENEKDEQQNIRQERWALPDKNVALENQIKAMISQGSAHYMKPKDKDDKAKSSDGTQIHSDGEEGKENKSGAGPLSSLSGRTSQKPGDKKTSSAGSGGANMPHFLAGGRQQYMSPQLGRKEEASSQSNSQRIVSVRDKTDSYRNVFGLSNARQRKEAPYMPQTGLGGFTPDSALTQKKDTVQETSAKPTQARPGLMGPVGSGMVTSFNGNIGKGLPPVATGTTGASPQASAGIDSKKPGAGQASPQGTAGAQEKSTPQAPLLEPKVAFTPSAAQQKLGESKPQVGGDKASAPPQAGGDKASAPPQAGGNKASAPPQAGDDKASAPPQAGGNKASAPPQAGGDKASAPPQAGGDKASAPPQAGGDKASAPPQAGGDKASAPPQAGGDKASAPPQADGDKASAPPQAGGDKASAPPQTGGDKASAPPQAGGDKASAPPPVGGDKASALPQAGGDKKTETTTQPAAAQETKKEEDPQALKYQESKWYKGLSKEEQQKTNTSFTNLSVKDRQSFDKSMGSLEAEEQKKALSWMEQAKDQKNPDEVRSQIAQNLESLTDKAKDPAVRSDAMKLLDGAKPEDRAGMIDKMATSLGGIDTAQQKDFLKLLNNAPEVDGKDGKKFNSRNELLTIAGNMDPAERNSLVKSLGSLSPEQLQKTMQHAAKSDYYNKMEGYGSNQTKADALKLTSLFFKDGGVQRDSAQIDNLVKSTQDTLGKSEIDRKSVMDKMMKGDPKVAVRTMEFMEKPDERTLGGKTIDGKPLETTKLTKLPPEPGPKATAEEKAAYQKAVENRQADILLETHTRLNMGNATELDPQFKKDMETKYEAKLKKDNYGAKEAQDLMAKKGMRNLFLSQHFSAEEREKLAQNPGGIQQAIQDKLIQEKVNGAGSSSESLNDALKTIGYSDKEIADLKKAKTQQIDQKGADQLTVMQLNLSRQGRARGDVSNEYLLNTQREISNVTIDGSKDAKPSFNSETRGMVIPKSMTTPIDRTKPLDPAKAKEMDKNMALLSHELNHAAYKGAMDKENSGSQIGLAFVSKSGQLTEKMRDPEFQTKCLSSIESTYKALGYSDQQIRNIKDEALRDPDELLAHYQTIEVMAKNAKDPKVKEAAQKSLEQMPKEIGDFTKAWKKGELPKNEQIYDAAVKTEIGDKNREFKGISDNYYQTLQSDLNANKQFRDNAAKRLEELGVPQADIQKKINEMLADPAKFADGFKDLAVKSNSDSASDGQKQFLSSMPADVNKQLNAWRNNNNIVEGGSYKKAYELLDFASTNEKGIKDSYAMLQDLKLDKAIRKDPIFQKHLNKLTQATINADAVNKEDPFGGFGFGFGLFGFGGGFKSIFADMDKDFAKSGLDDVTQNIIKKRERYYHAIGAHNFNAGENFNHQQQVQDFNPAGSNKGGNLNPVDRIDFTTRNTVRPNMQFPSTTGSNPGQISNNPAWNNTNVGNNTGTNQGQPGANRMGVRPDGLQNVSQNYGNQYGQPVSNPAGNQMSNPTNPTNQAGYQTGTGTQTHTDIYQSNPEEQVDFSDRTMAVLEKKRAQAEAVALKAEESEAQQAEEAKQQEQAQTAEKQEESNKTMEAMKPLLNNSTPEAAQRLADLLATRASSPDSAKELLKNFMSMLGGKDGPKQAAQFLSLSSGSPAGTASLMQFLTAGSQDAEGGAMAARFLEAGTSNYEGSAAMHKMMSNLSARPEDAQSFARMLNLASNSPDGSASLGKMFQNLAKFPSGSENIAQFMNSATQTPMGGKDMSQTLANMSSSREGSQALANLFNKMSSSPQAAQNMMSSLQQMSSTKDGARFLSHAMANTSSFPETAKGMAKLIQMASSSGEGTQSLFTAMKNMSASPDGAKNIALFLQRGASTGEGADALARAMRTMTSSGQGTQDMTALFSKAAGSPQGATSLSQALLQMSNGRSNGDAFLSFIQKASMTPRSSGEMGNLLSQLSSTPEGANNLAQMMNKLSSGRDGSRTMMQTFANLASTTGGAKSLSAAFANMAEAPQGGAALTQMLSKASSTPEGTRMLFQTFSNMSASSDGARSMSQFFERASLSREGSDSLSAILKTYSTSQDGVRSLTNLLARGSASEDGGAALSKALLNMSSGRGGSESLNKYLLSASNNPETALTLSKALAGMTANEEGGKALSQLIARTPNTPEGQQAVMKAFSNMSMSPEGAQSLSKMMSNISRSGDGAQNLAAFINNSSATPQGSSSMLNMMSKMMATPDGAKDVALFLQRSTSTPQGAQNIAGTINNFSASREGVQQFLQLLGNTQGGATAGKAFSQTLANLASTPGGSASIGNLLNQSLATPGSTEALTKSLLSMSSTREGALNISQFVSSYSGNADGAKVLMDAFSKMGTTPQGMNNIATLLERGTNNPEGAKLLNNALLNMSSSREGADSMAKLLANTSASPEGTKALNRAMVNMSFTAEGATGLGDFFSRMSSSSTGAQSMTTMLRNLTASSEGAENVALFFQKCSTSPQGLSQLQNSLLNLASMPDGSEGVAQLLSRSSGTEFGGKAILGTFQNMSGSQEGAHKLALLLQQTSSSPKGAGDFAAFIKNTTGSENVSGWPKMLSEMSKDSSNVGAMAKWVGNMNRTAEGREVMMDFLSKGASTSEGGRHMARFFDQASTNPDLKRQLDALIQDSSKTERGAARASTMMDNINKGRRDQVLSGTRSSEAAVMMKGEEGSSMIANDLKASLHQRPLMGSRGVMNSEAEQVLIKTQMLEAQTRKSELQMENRLTQSVSEKALNTSTMGEKGMDFRQNAINMPFGVSTEAAAQSGAAKMASTVRGIDKVSEMKRKGPVEETDEADGAEGMSEGSEEMKAKKHPQFRPLDIYPESLLRYLNICPECGTKCRDRDVMCMKCEMEYNRQVYTASAVKFSRGGYYFRTHEDKLEFSGGAEQIFTNKESDVSDIAVLRQPPKYPKYSEFLALSHA
ncbi:MAG: hypothetical protein AB9903_19355 [Vulcanimicrobiota bacterium]